MIKNYRKLLRSTAFILISMMSLTTVYADGSNFFVSFLSSNNVRDIANYGKQNNVGGYMVWDISGDLPAGAPGSLLGTINDVYGTSQPIILSYYENWSTYSTHSIVSQPYPVPGSNNPVINTTETNADMTGKLDQINMLAYAFLESEPATASAPGTIFFFDPWSDLMPANKFAAQDNFCASNNDTCWYVFDHKTPAVAHSGGMGNFIAFSQLNNTQNNLKKIISIGGYSHDATFETLFDGKGGLNSAYEKNFIVSLRNIITSFGLQGVDLDYENTNMTYASSVSFATLVQDLRAALPTGTLINVAILSSPSYLEGTGGAQGFNPKPMNTSGQNALQVIAANANTIDLMTYDFHGLFDYTPGGNNNYTGFLSSLYVDNQDPFTSDHKFSIDTSLKAIQSVLGTQTPLSHILIGLPAYGRAFQGVPAKCTTIGDCLFAPIPSTATVPGGDLDPISCETALPSSQGISSDSCSGQFSYKYIMKNIYGPSMSIAETEDSVGTVGYGSWTPPQFSNFTLEVTNTGTIANDDLSVSVTIAGEGTGAFTSDDLAPGINKTYDNTTTPSALLIEGQSNLFVKWTTYTGGPAGICPGSFDFLKYTHVMIVVNNQGQGTCQISQ